MAGGRRAPRAGGPFRESQRRARAGVQAFGFGEGRVSVLAELFHAGYVDDRTGIGDVHTHRPLDPGSAQPSEQLLHRRLLSNRGFPGVYYRGVSALPFDHALHFAGSAASSGETRVSGTKVAELYRAADRGRRGGRRLDYVLDVLLAG